MVTAALLTLRRRSVEPKATSDYVISPTPCDSEYRDIPYDYEGPGTIGNAIKQLHET